MHNVTESRSCHVCSGSNLEYVFEAPGLPLTGLYIRDDMSAEVPRYDQALMYCMDCGHGQLRNLIPAELLYDSTYTHRTSSSPIATRGNDFFSDQLKVITNGRKYKSLLEVGCNDLYLLHKCQDLADHLVGVDPIWAGRDHALNSKTKVLGGFVEDIVVGTHIDTAPDLIISAHTFEHIHDLYGQFSRLVDIAADGCIFVIEMPCFETAVRLRRFDQVFHQHIQYLSLSSMRRLVERLGCSFIGHVFNHHYWGGTLMFWFEKRRAKTSVGKSGHEPLQLQNVTKAYSEFRDALGSAHEQAVSLKETCFGFGAAQMLPILAYHMESDLGFMQAILDDNQERWMSRLPGVKPLIRGLQENELTDAAVMITALDSARPIVKRLLGLNPRRILYPLHNF